MAWLMSNAIYGCEKVPIPPNTEQINKMNCRRIEHKKSIQSRERKTQNPNRFYGMRHKVGNNFKKCHNKCDSFSGLMLISAFK